MKDILLDENDDLAIVNGDFVLGESTVQELGIILRLNQGELKSDPLLGPGLAKMIRSVGNKLKYISKIKLHLARDGKDYEKLKSIIKINA